MKRIFSGLFLVQLQEETNHVHVHSGMVCHSDFHLCLEERPEEVFLKGDENEPFSSVRILLHRVHRRKHHLSVLADESLQALAVGFEKPAAAKH